MAATLVGSNPTAQSGDRLFLVFSRDVSIGNQPLADADLVLDAGGSLGQASQARLYNPRTVEVTLGTGVDMVPGTTTLDFDGTSLTIQDAVGKPIIGSEPRTLQKGDGDHPEMTGLTLSGVSTLLNGEGAAGGTLMVPQAGFTIDLTCSDATSALDPSRTILVADTAVAVDGVRRDPGESITDALTLDSSTATSMTYSVPSRVEFAVGATVLTAYLVDQSGMVSLQRSFSFAVSAMPNNIRPFESGQVWFLDFSRDLESYAVDIFDNANPVAVIGSPNGTPDLEDLLLVLGLHSATPPAIGGETTNDHILTVFKDQLLADLAAFYDSSGVSFTLLSPGDFPTGIASLPYSGFTHSQICIGGADESSGQTGTLGVAIFDPQNRTHDNNCLTEFSGFQRLGVFVHTLVLDGFRSHATTTFRFTFDPFTPSRGGIPVGDSAQDVDRLLGVLQDGRADDITSAIRRLARYCAVLTAHECGHSVGLVANNAMPNGLFGNDPVNFPVFPASGANGHIKMPGSLYSGAGQNIMAPFFDFDAGIASSTRFNTLNMAYLREQVTHN